MDPSDDVEPSPPKKHRTDYSDVDGLREQLRKAPQEEGSSTDGASLLSARAGLGRRGVEPVRVVDRRQRVG